MSPLFLTVFSFCFFFSFVARGAEGFNSVAGTSLPIGAGDTSVMWIKPNGSVLISATNAEAKARLDVDGGIRIGVDANPSNCASSNRAGALAYFSTLDPPGLWYCDGTQWKALSGCPKGYMLNDNEQCIEWPFKPNPGQCVKADGSIGNITFRSWTTMNSNTSCKQPFVVHPTPSVSAGCSGAHPDGSETMSIAGTVICYGSSTTFSKDPKYPSCVRPDMSYGYVAYTNVTTLYWSTWGSSGSHNLVIPTPMPANTTFEQGDSRIDVYWYCD